MRKLLFQFDTDPHPATFDGVVARDAGADDVLAFGSVTPDVLPGLLHGGMFTRHPRDLRNTAVFLGGSSLAAGRELLDVCKKTFFGPMRLSVMLDPNGSQSTAAAAVHMAARMLGEREPAVVLGYGPVGATAAELLDGLGVPVTLAGRNRTKCEAAAVGNVIPETLVSDGLKAALSEARVLISAGAAGVEMLPGWRGFTPKLVAAIDLNAVPPAGLMGIEPADNEVEREGLLCTGALGVGGLKMELHRAAITTLFEANDKVIAAKELLEMARTR